MAYSFTLSDLRDLLGGGVVKGSGKETFQGIASLENAGPSDLSFLGNPKYGSMVDSCKAGVILLPHDFEGEPPKGQVYLMVENPSLALAQLCRKVELETKPRPKAGIHPSAVVDPRAQVDPSAHVGPFCQIETGAVIGANSVLVGHNYVGQKSTLGQYCWLAPRAVVMDLCSLGNRVILQPGAVIGADGFGYETSNGVHEKVPQIGGVSLEDDVEIGANTTIDRARFDLTRIGQGSKVDNLVQIGHNTTLGRGCIIVSQTGISGSTHLGDYVVLGGQVGIAGHLRIGSGSKVGAQSGVPSDLPEKSFVRGSPAESYYFEQKLTVLRRRLPEFVKRLSSVEEKVDKFLSLPASSND